jgi:predicted DNA-binding transcriptional regulator YafY
LYRLVTTLAKNSRRRKQLIRQGRAGMRTFYRDLTFLEICGIEVRVTRGRYELAGSVRKALGRLPFPPPELSFADVLELSKGRTAAHRKLRAQLAEIIG